MTSVTRRTICAAGLLCLAVGSASAQEAAGWPDRPIELVVLNGPGGASDIFARALGRAAEPIFGQPVVVINKPGGGGATQLSVVRAAEPDGYTLGVNTLTHFTAMETNLKGIFSPGDFSWIALLQQDAYLLFVDAKSPYQTFGDLVAGAKAKGGAVTIGGFGTVGSTSNIAAQMVLGETGLTSSWVGYDATTDVVVGVLGGHIELGSGNPGPVMEFAKAGRVRILGIASAERIQVLPDVPTFAEQGYAVDTGWQQIRGLFGPAGIPAEIQEKIAAGFFKAMQDPEFQKYQTESGIIGAEMVPEAYAAYVSDMSALAEDALKKLGIAQ